MTVQELAERLISHPLDRFTWKVVVRVNEPHQGRLATCEIEQANFGSDWDKGTFILTPKEQLWIPSKQIVEKNHGC